MDHRQLCALLALLWTVPAARAGEAADAAEALFAAPAVAVETLESLRGGFEAPDGLQVSFGIERVVRINGVLQDSIQVRAEDVALALGTGAPSLPAEATLTLVQNGLNNSVTIELPTAALATIVQNSLASQHLQVLTIIDASVNSAEMLRGLRMQQSVQDAANRAALLH